MNTELAYLKLLLNDIHVDLGIFLNISNDSSFSPDPTIQIADFKERVANLKNANNKYQLDLVKRDIDKFVSKIQDDFDFSLDNKQQITQLQEAVLTIMKKIADN